MNAQPSGRTPAPASTLPPSHWAAQRERGSLFWMRLGFGAARLLGRRVLAPIVWLVVGYFYCSRRAPRRAIAQYQQRLRECDAALRLPRLWPVYRQYLAFAQAILDRFEVWYGRIGPSDLQLLDPHALHTQMGRGRGQIVITAHLGNMDVTRALAQQVVGLTLNVLVHSRHMARVNTLLAEQGASVQLIQISELDAARMLDLAQRIERGEWLAIAGDRVPVAGERTTEVQFLGAPAHMPQGPWLLAALLGCPVNLLLCLRNPAGAPKRFQVVMERLLEAPDWPRRSRAQHIAASAQHYADRLAVYCRAAPLQWFNFYPFWRGN